MMVVMAWEHRLAAIRDFRHAQLKLSMLIQELENAVQKLAVDWRKTADNVPDSLALTSQTGRYEDNAKYFECVASDLVTLKKWMSLLTAEPNKTESRNPATKKRAGP